MPLAVCATPIGNLDDVTLRVLAELEAADLVLCEDTRRTRILLDRHGIAGLLRSYERHSEARRTDEVIPLLEEGCRVALVTDAGLPGVNDPGGRLIAEAIARDLPVTVLPGPSAVETALVLSGFAGPRYAFLGYLPRNQAGRISLWQELTQWNWPVVAFESPKRLPAALASLAASDPNRPVAVCRELTKRFEEVVRGTASDVARRFSDPPKGEITVVLGATVEMTRPTGAARTAMSEMIAAGVPRRRAARLVGDVSGIPANQLYRDSL